MPGARPAAAQAAFGSRTVEAIQPLGQWQVVDVTMGRGRLRQTIHRQTGLVASDPPLHILPRHGAGDAPVSGLLDVAMGRQLAVALRSPRAVALTSTFERGHGLRQFLTSSLRRFAAHTGELASRAYVGISETSELDGDLEDRMTGRELTSAEIAHVLDNPRRPPLDTLREWHREEAVSALAGTPAVLIGLPRGAIHVGRDGVIDVFPEGEVEHEPVDPQERQEMQVYHAEEDRARGSAAPAAPAVPSPALPVPQQAEAAAPEAASPARASRKRPREAAEPLVAHKGARDDPSDRPRPAE